MPRILDPDELLESAMPPDGVAQPAHQPQVVPQTDPKLALGMYGVRLQLPDSPLLRRCFHSIVAMHQAAHNCDYYITKYQGKPMQAMTPLFAAITHGIRKPEEQERLAAQLPQESPSDAPQPAAE